MTLVDTQIGVLCYSPEKYVDGEVSSVVRWRLVLEDGTLGIQENTSPDRKLLLNRHPQNNRAPPRQREGICESSCGACPAIQRDGTWHWGAAGEAHAECFWQMGSLFFVPPTQPCSLSSMAFCFYFTFPLNCQQHAHSEGFLHLFSFIFSVPLNTLNLEHTHTTDNHTLTRSLTHSYMYTQVHLIPRYSLGWLKSLVTGSRFDPWPFRIQFPNPHYPTPPSL